jgi:hypothetical protein
MGLVFSRMYPFNWKQKLNKNQDWTFPGSTWKREGNNTKQRDTGEYIYWNFKNAYCCYNYFRIT